MRSTEWRRAGRLLLQEVPVPRMNSGLSAAQSSSSLAGQWPNSSAAIASTNRKGSPFCFSLLTSCCSAAGRMPAPGQAVFTCSLLFSLLQNPCAQVKAIPPITAVPMARPDLDEILALPLIANSWASPAALGTAEVGQNYSHLHQFFPLQTH